MSKHVVVGVTGSIAAYKACELVRLFAREGVGVTVAMTVAAEKFVSALTFRTLSQNPVCTGLFDDVEEWSPKHISLSDRCDALVIAPCTANVIAKLACGIGDDSLTSLALSCAKPLFVAPAMNVNMWNHPATQANVKTLRGRGAVVLEPDAGFLACGVTAKGRMPEPEAIFRTVMDAIGGGKAGK